jgi:transketolase
MVGAALGLSRRGKIPFVSTFAAFLSRAFDQIRMSQYADSNIKFCGSHAGVSIGEDGASQMALEDIAMFRSVFGGVVLYPSDAVSTEKLVAEAAGHQGNVYIRTTRKETPIIYDNNNDNYNFRIGGSCTLKSSTTDVATVIGAGVTLHEALAAYEELKKEGINIRVIDLYSIKPIDTETLKKAAEETKNIITVEDHFAEGGLGEAVASTLATISNIQYLISKLAVNKMPKSGKPDELLAYEEINASAIVKKVKTLLNTN